MKKALRFCALSLLCLSPVLLPALPKVAVLDLTLQKGIDSTVIIPVTESIMEEVVGARAYVVLDRAYIEQILKEKEFQMSGLVSDTQVAQAGQYLGADYVVAGKIQLVGETYFVVSKMIEVKTGVIVAQSSEQGEGKVSVLLSMARAVGKKLVGGSPISALTPATPSPFSASSPVGGGKDDSPGERPSAENGQPAFSGADKEDIVPQGPVTLSLMSQYDPKSEAGKVWRETMDAFRAKYPNIKIDEQNFKDAGPYWKQLEARMKSGKAPDIMKLDMGARSDPSLQAMDLGPALRGRGEAFLPSVRRLMSGPKGVFFLPESVKPSHVFYANRRLLDKLGLPLPDSLESLITQQPQLKKAGLIGIAWSEKEGWQAQSSLLSALASDSGGPGWVSRAVRKDGASFRDPSFVEALGVVKRLSDAKLFPPNLLSIDYGVSIEMFNSGKAAYMIDGGWRLGQIAPDLDVAVSCLPGMGRPGTKGLTTASVPGYGMNAKLSGEKAQAAWLWLWFYSGPEGAKIRFQHGGAFLSAVDPRHFLDGVDGRLAQYYDFLGEAEIDDIMDSCMDTIAVNEALKQILAGKKKPAAAAEEIEKWAEKNLPDRRR